MRRWVRRLWPSSLAGRLVLLLVAALAVAQLMLVLLLRSQQEAVVEGIVRGQALSQTVTLARLLDAFPPAEGDRLAAAFGSRQACARISREPPPERTMSDAEEDLAELLGRMLHGVNAGPPEIVIDPEGGRGHPCGLAGRPSRAGPAAGDGPAVAPGENAAAAPWRSESWPAALRIGEAQTAGHRSGRAADGAPSGAPPGESRATDDLQTAGSQGGVRAGSQAEAQSGLQGDPQAARQGRPQGAVEGSLPAQPQGGPHAANGGSQDGSQGAFQGGPQGRPQGALQGALQGASQGESRAEPPSAGPPRLGGPPAWGRRVAAVGLMVPLGDGRWLTVRTAVDLPPAWSRPTLLSFLLSAVLAAAVTLLCVRTQTRSLRSLAEASERFGRGESVAPLAVEGPAEVAAAIRAFNTMQDRLGLFLRDRMKLLAGVSHDLRTPLTTLRLKAEFIDDETVREDVVATIDELAAICEATLAFTRAEAIAEASVVADLRGLAEEVADPFRLAGADVMVMPGPSHATACRPVALKRALRNLVENAVRYGRRARIVVAAQDATVSLAVDDDGPGLPADRMEDAFQPFVRLEPSRSAETGGLGLGLAIARSIVRAHGGTLTLENRREGGLRAEIRLPAPHHP